HARLGPVDLRHALAVPGVHAVLTGVDAAHVAKPLRPKLGIPGFKVCELPCLAIDRVRFQGQPVALVAAGSRALAEDALERIDVEYQPLPAVVDARKAIEPDAPLLHDDWGDNVHVESTYSAGDVAAAFERAEVKVAQRFRTGRYTGVPVEPRAVLASYEAATGELTVWSSTQVPHLLRTALADALSFPEHQLRVIAPDVGGGFGIKAVIYPEEIAVALLALRLGCPLHWQETRREHLQAAAHARQQDLFVEAATTADGRLLGVRFDLVGDVGAYSCYPFTSAIETLQTGRHLPGPYRFDTYAHHTRAVVTNKSPVGPCRAVSRPVGNLVMETLMDLIAERTGLDPAEVRRRNLVQPGDFPYASVTRQVYDSGSYVAALDRVLDMIDYAAFRAYQAQARQQGRYLGIGISSYVEQTAQGTASFTARGMDSLAGYDSAIVRMEPSGQLVVAVGVSDHGQGHHTTLAQLAAQELSLPLADVRVVHGDTAVCPYGMGTFTSRSAVCGGGAVVLASRKLRQKLLRIAGQLLEVSADDLELTAGRACVRGAASGRFFALRDLARVAYHDVSRLPRDLEPRLEEAAQYDASEGTYSNAAHAAVVEVDPETGAFQFVRYCVVEDCGTMINPLIVEGQIHGAVAQGVGGAAHEELVYGQAGELLTGSFLDYAVPQARAVPRIEIDHLVSPSPFTPLGIKGMGEGGTVSPGAVLACALSDALSPFGVRFTELPITPEKVRAALESTRR
ncbi:MAG TPA: xanthine dehydrogenase family protein molybdopterin-binding subunit, partial [Chloroflexota bacterium]|nr:xanthine dehydrogenase family protein molybdopterin-binding subunit [Chloroflexota bacterium]